jgi:hypothetical protein
MLHHETPWRSIMSETFTSFEICKNLKISRPTLQDWIARGFIHPSTRASGRGTKNSFSRDNLYQIELFRILVSRGFNRSEIGKWVRDIPCGKFSKVALKDDLFLVVGILRKKGNPVVVTVYLSHILGKSQGPFHGDVTACDEIHFIKINSVIEKIDRIFP